MASIAVYRQNGVDYTIDDPTVANVFLEDVDYPVGSYVKIGGGLRRFTTAHPAGAWIGTDAVNVDVCNEIKKINNAVVSNIKNSIGLNVMDGATNAELADAGLFESIIIYNVDLTGYRITAVLDNASYTKTIHLRTENNLYNLAYNSTTGLNVWSNGAAKIEVKFNWDKYENGVNVSYEGAKLEIVTDNETTRQFNDELNIGYCMGKVESLEESLYFDIVKASESNALLPYSTIDNMYIEKTTGTTSSYSLSKIVLFAVEASKTYHIYGISRFNGDTGCLVGFKDSDDKTVYQTLVNATDNSYKYLNFVYTPRTDGYIGFTELKADAEAGLNLNVNLLETSNVVKYSNLESAIKSCFSVNHSATEISGSFTRVSKIINPDGTIGNWANHDTHHVISYPVKKNETVVVYGISRLLGTYYPLAVFGTNSENWTHEIISPDNGNVMTEYEVAFTAPDNGFVMLYVISDGEHGSLKCYAPAFAITGGIQKKTLKLQAFGDSITDNENNTWSGHTTWLNYIEDILSPFFNLTVTNSAYGGATLANQNNYSLVNRLCGNETLGVQSLFDSTADIVMIWAGTNDWAGSGSQIGTRTDADTTIAGAIAKCIEYVSDNSKAVVIVATPMQRYNDVDAEREVNQDGEPVNNLGYSLKQVCEAIESVCNYYGVDCIRMDKIAGFNRINIRKFASDGLHPHDEGANKRIGSIFGTEFRKMIL